MEKIPVVLRVSRAGNGFSQMPGDRVFVSPSEALAMIQAGQVEEFEPDEMEELERMVAAAKVPPIPRLGEPFPEVPPGSNSGDDGSNGENDDPPSSGKRGENETPPGTGSRDGGGETGGTGDAGDETGKEPDGETGTPLGVLKLPEKAEQLLRANGLTTVEQLDAYTVDMELENLDGIGSGWAEHIRKNRAAYQPAK